MDGWRWPWTGDAADQAALDSSTRAVLREAQRLGEMRGADAPQLLRAYGSLILADYTMSVRLHRQGATQ